jgi:hypothetical protein
VTVIAAGFLSVMPLFLGGCQERLLQCVVN